MSLLFHRRAIERAVAGEMTGGEELVLREHLTGCARCRGHYDRLVLAVRALRSDASASATERARESARVFAAIDVGRPDARPALAPVRTFSGWLEILVPAATAAAILLAVATGLPGTPADRDVGWRGIPAGGERARPLQGPGEAGESDLGLIVYASRKEGGEPGPVRLVAELPGSGEGRLSVAEYVQFSYRHRRDRTYLYVVGLDARGEFHVYHPLREWSDAGPLARAAAPRPLGPSVDLERRHAAGLLRVWALSANAPLDRDQVERAALAAAADLSRSIALDLPAGQVSGLFRIEP